MKKILMTLSELTLSSIFKIKEFYNFLKNINGKFFVFMNMFLLRCKGVNIISLIEDLKIIEMSTIV